MKRDAAPGRGDARRPGPASPAAAWPGLDPQPGPAAAAPQPGRGPGTGTGRPGDGSGPAAARDADADTDAAAGPAPAGELGDELVRLMARQGRRVSVPVFLCAVLLAAMAAVPLGPLAPGLWLAAVGGVLVLRWQVFGSLPAAVRPAREKLRALALLSGLNGAVHGVSTAFIAALPAPERAVHTTVLLGLCAGSLATTGGWLPGFAAFVVPTLLPLAAVWALDASGAAFDWTGPYTALLILLFGGVLMSMAGETFRLLEGSFRIRQEQDGLNRQLRGALDEAQAASRAKTRFLASASHDLRQPMHTLSLFGAALALRPLDEPTAQIARHMNTALQTLGAQLDALLDVSKLDAGIVPVRRTTFSLAGFLSALEHETWPLAERRGLTLRCDCPVTAWCETDEMLLARILRNLLDNAMKYTPSGGVALRAEAAAGSDAWLVTVEDTGIGIPAAEQQRVFEEFYQLDNPERDRSRGLGLGLSIVRRLAQLLGLRMHLSSAPGHGTRVSLAVPRGRPADAAGGPPSAAGEGAPVRGSLAGVEVIVLDDEEAVRRGMEMLLRELGCGVRSAGRTVEALALAHAAAPDLLLVDLRLRGSEDGIRAVRAMRAMHAGLPALLVTGDTAPDRLRQAHAAGIPMLHKPVSAAALHRAMTQLLGRDAPPPA